MALANPETSQDEAKTSSQDLNESPWEYDRQIGTNVFIEPKFKESILNTENDIDYKTNLSVIPSPFRESIEPLEFGFSTQPRPFLPSELLDKFNKMKEMQLTNQEWVDLVEDIARISVEFYKVKLGTFIAIMFDGRIVEAADTKIDLLLKIQRRKFGKSIIVWEAGSESFSGWKL